MRWKHKGSGQKQVYLLRLGPKTGNSKIKYKTHSTSPAMFQSALYLFWGRTKPRYTRVCLLCLTFNCFLSFFSQSETLHSSTLCPPYECRRTGRPLPLPTPHTAPYEQHTYLPTHLRRDMIHTTYGYQFSSWSQTAVRQLHPKSR